MKLIKEDGKVVLESETLLEAAAILYIKDYHVSFFVGQDIVRIQAFEAGAQWAMRQVCDKLPGLGLTDEGFEAVIELLRRYRT